MAYVKVVLGQGQVARFVSETNIRKLEALADVGGVIEKDDKGKTKRYTESQLVATLPSKTKRTVDEIFK